MKKFVFVYYGKNKAEDMKPENVDEVMKKWGAWYESIGDKLVDGGNPFASVAKRVSRDGVEAIAEDQWPSKGYTIVNAETMEAAIEIAKGCPMLQDDPEGTVRVYEAMPM